MTHTRRVFAVLTDFVTVWGAIIAIVTAGFVVTYRYVGSPPPTTLRIAAGAANGAYYAFAQQYARSLAADGISLEVVPTAGSVENLDLLRRGEVTLALVQGGSATPADRERLQTLGSLFLEPVWVFTRASTTIQRLSDLKGSRVAVGAVGSGTFLLATQLLSVSGVSESNTMFRRSDTAEASRLLSGGDVEAGVFVAASDAPVIQDLIRQPALVLFDFERAPAYSRVFPYLTPVVLSEGVLDLERNLPPRDTTLVAAAASLAVREDLHPGLIPALLDTVTRVHRPAGVLERPRQFPSVDFVDLPLNEDAGRYIREGPSFLYRWLPYTTAVLLDRLKILVLPFLALLIPLSRTAPLLYQWRVRSKIYRWYAEVREIDSILQAEADSRLEEVTDRLAALEREVASLSIPLAYAGELYHLRLHVRLLQDKRAERLRAEQER